MTPLQSFNLIDRITKALAVMDEKSRSNEEHSSKMLWNEDFKFVRMQIFLALDTAKNTTPVSGN